MENTLYGDDQIVPSTMEICSTVNPAECVGNLELTENTFSNFQYLDSLSNKLH